MASSDVARASTLVRMESVSSSSSGLSPSIRSFHPRRASDPMVRRMQGSRSSGLRRSSSVSRVRNVLKMSNSLAPRREERILNPGMRRASEEALRSRRARLCWSPRPRLQRPELTPIGALALTVTACGTLRPASVGGGECQVFEQPEYAVLGQSRYDQNWIDSNTEAGVAACGWQRPKPRPQVLGRAPSAKHLAPTKKKQPGVIGRIKHTATPSASAQPSTPAMTPGQEPPLVPDAPARPRDPVDELLEPDDAPPAKPPGRPCWWC
jgi:hypothetical protein